MTVLKLHIKAGTDVSFSRELLIKFQGVGGYQDQGKMAVSSKNRE